MSLKNFLISVALLFSLIIYLFFRVESTVVSQIAIWSIGTVNFTFLKSLVLETISFSPLIIYSLPQGLWIFALTLASHAGSWNNKKLDIAVVIIPISTGVLFEVFQYLKVLSGTFDINDLLLSIIFWLAGLILTSLNIESSGIDRLKFRKISLLTGCYAIVYLAHVN